MPVPLCVLLYRVGLSAALSCPPGESGGGSGCCGVSPTAGYHQLRDVTRCRVSGSKVPLRRGSCRALKDSPPAPLQQRKLQSWSEGSHLLCAEVLLQRCHSCARCTEAQPPAGVVSRLLHYSSLAQRLGRTLPVSAGALGHPRGALRLCRTWVLLAWRVLVGRSVAFGGLCAGGARGTGEVMHPRSLRPTVTVGRPLCCSGKAPFSKTPHPKPQSPLGAMPCPLLAAGEAQMWV